MFEQAVDQVSRFTRPVHTIMRSYGSTAVFPGSATLFFVDDGVALTCRHVAEQIINADKVNQHYLMYAQARFRLKNDHLFNENLRQLELQYKYSQESIVQVKHNFVNCFDRITGIECHLHSVYDLALIRFKGFQKMLYSGRAVFVKDGNTARPGKSMCRLGFPFPEFSNYRYNYQTDEIEWTREGNPNSPSFPIDGIITRLIAQSGRISGIEMSTPGLRGQSGGPLFDNKGIIYGMQSSTRHLHLGFDLENFEVVSGPSQKKITNTPFLHVGQCVHVEVIKEFLREQQVPFEEAS